MFGYIDQIEWKLYKESFQTFHKECMFPQFYYFITGSFMETFRMQEQMVGQMIVLYLDQQKTWEELTW